MPTSDRASLAPDAVAAVAGRLLPGETARHAVRGDLSASLRFGETWVVATDRRILSFEPEKPGELRHEIALSDVKNVEVSPAVGGGALLVTTSQGSEAIARFTNARTEPFAAAARAFRQLALRSAAPVVPPARPERCPTCGRLLPNRSERCPFCVRYLETIRRIAAYLRPYRARVGAVVALTLATTAFQLIPPLVTRRLVDDVLPKGDLAVLGALVALLAVVQVLSSGCLVLSGAALAWIGGRIGGDLRNQVFARIERLPVSFHDRRAAGQVFSRVMNDTSQLQQFLIEGMPYFLQNTLLLLGVLSVLVALAPDLALLVLAPVPFVFAAQYGYWRNARVRFHRWWNQLSFLQSRLMESISGTRVTKAFVQERRESEAFDAQNLRLFEAQVAADRLGAVFQPAMHFLFSIGILLVWYFGGGQAARNEITLGTLIAFVAYLWMFYMPLQWFSQVNNWMTRAFAGAERVFETLESSAEPLDAPDAAPLVRARGEIEFRDVSFSYEKGRSALRGVSFRIRAGERIGLVGRSGSGKSTLLALLARFYDPDEGEALLDGRPLPGWKLEDLRRAIGSVPQDPFLFGTSLLENIRYGRPGAADREVVDAARAANAHAFIQQKPDGYDTRVGERGSRLSGGERQRIAIARALLAGPRMLLLDEATSSVDSETESKIQESLERLMAGRTTLIAAHRLSTLRSVDRIFVLDGGTLVEQGPHAVLMRRRGRYFRLVRAQERLWKKARREMPLDPSGGGAEKDAA